MPPVTGVWPRGREGRHLISIIEEQHGKQPPDLTDDQWDHGASDGEIFSVIKRGVPPTMMPSMNGVISDTDIWSVINYVRSLGAEAAGAGSGRHSGCGNAIVFVATCGIAWSPAIVTAGPQ